MKKIFGLMLLCVAMLVGCYPIEGPNAGNNETKGLAYTVIVNMGIKKLDTEYGTTSTLNVTFFEYNDKNEMVNNQSWNNVTDNATKRVTSHKLATKMVVYIEMDSYVHSTGKTSEFNRYVAQVFYLENNMQITIDGNTRISEYHPLK